jgi:very-short-patch-repair endonuclease
MLEAWSTHTAELARVHGLAAPLAIVQSVTRLIAESGAPQYAQALRQPIEDEVDQLLPDTWQRAWRLRRLATHLAAIDSQDEFKKLARVRTDLEHDLARAYHAMVVKRTWRKLAENATPNVRAGLQAYLNAIQKIGKGTGKRAVRYRQDARYAAAEAIPAVPCWIMPHYRVSESLPPQLGCFDLVVIDEASQSDLSALPTLLRARKLLIVGDDQQVSPEAVGLEEQKIKTLMQRFLTGQVPLYRAQMSPERSIYDLAKVVFARSGVVLKEHFRCVAPIIEYSKREFYGHELRPLRLPRLSERLDPPLVDVLIEDGHRNGGVNGAEVDFIVEEIGRVIADPRMDGRSIGVVSLLGEEQALTIWDRLNDEYGPQLLQRHRIACGDARTFQGRERDVIFLSLVCAPNDVGAPLSRDIFAQRFNVAASRARDRMYLVRSVELAQLSEADRLRRGLIGHFAQPFPQDQAPPGDQRALCESPFERELYDWLMQQGYRATPQVRVGAYRVDLVVEGNNDARLAIECDGDQHQGPEQWAHDVRRQRVLERAGWKFWRCFAATFVRRRAAVLEDLHSMLAANGIEPPGTQGAPLSVHTQMRRANKPVEARTMVVQAAAIQWGVPAPERKAQDHGAVHTGTPRAEPGFEPGGQ